MQLQQDTLFANRYNLIQLLGRGGFSEVWLAKDNWTHLQIAIKVYAPGMGMDANGLQEFCGELANVFDLNHSNLLKPTHVDTWNDMPYLIMAYCSQGSLANKIGKMSEEQMWQLIHDVASGLAYLHDRDVVHQDIKPDNILVDEYNHYVITDFGISTRARSTLRKSVMGGTAQGGGTTAYMGPERFSKQPAPTKASDIWSFGAMCYELIEGVVPFGDVGGGLQKSGAEIPSITVNVSDALKYTIIKMLSKETWDRPIATTLMEWSANPSAIVVDYDLLTEEESHDRPGIDGPSQPVHDYGHATRPLKSDMGGDLPPINSDADKETKPAKKKRSKGAVAAIIIGVVFLIVGISGSVTVINRNIQQKQYVKDRHDSYLNDFDQHLSQATNIDSLSLEQLESAKCDLDMILMYERSSKYKGYMVGPNREAKFSARVDSLYDIADHKFRNAPSGTEAERRNLAKRNRIQQLKP